LPQKATVASVSTGRVTSTVAGYGAAGRASSGSASASAPTVVRPAMSPSGHGRGRASPTVAKNRSSDPCASAIVVAVIVRHQRPHTNRTADSTEPLRLARRDGQGSTVTP
jgi:hypothetical protein